MIRFTRAMALALALGSALAGCTTTASIDTQPIDVLTTGATTADDPRLGIDSHGNLAAVAYPSIPASNQIDTKGDLSRVELVKGKEAFIGDNFGNAERHFRKAVELRPDSVQAWAGLAASYDQIGRFDLAERAYGQLRKLKPRDARVLNNHGYSMLLRGEYVKAEKLFREARRLDPVLEEAEGNLQLVGQVRRS